MPVYDQVMEAVSFLRQQASVQPAVALILGSGLGELAEEVRDAVSIPYAQIPHFARSTVSGHAGRLLVGMLAAVPVVVMQGRFHFYEGYPPQVLTLPVRVMGALGAQTLLVTNAAGGLNPAYRPGDFMLISDHINLPGMAGANPLLGPNEERFGERFPPLARAYDQGLRTMARAVAGGIPDLTLHEGVYAMVSGPNFETKAELRFLRALGADAVGMSTAPEVVVARHMGLRVLGLSLITNTATGAEHEEIAHNAVLTVAQAARSRFVALVLGVLHGM
jgi:purine-nucleoside phosphorylase